MSTCAPPESPPVIPPVAEADRRTGPPSPAPSGPMYQLPLRLLAEAALFAIGVLAYFAVRGLTETDVDTARTHAAAIVGLERDLGIFVEPAAQRLLVPHDMLVTLANWIYIWGHWPVIVITAVWLAVRRPEAYRTLRNAMLLSGLIGIAIFVSFPVAPPRLAGAGLLDTITLHSDAYRVLQPPAFVNQYAAMPSLHVGWDLLVGLTIFRVAPNILLRVVGLIMPVLMAVAVVVTGNHYLLDVAAGVTVALLGAFAASQIRTLSRAVPAPGAPKEPDLETRPVPAVPRPRSALRPMADARTGAGDGTR